MTTSRAEFNKILEEYPEIDAYLKKSQGEDYCKIAARLDFDKLRSEQEIIQVKVHFPSNLVFQIAIQASRLCTTATGFVYAGTY